MCGSVLVSDIYCQMKKINLFRNLLLIYRVFFFFCFRCNMIVKNIDRSAHILCWADDLAIESVVDPHVGSATHKIHYPGGAMFCTVPPLHLPLGHRAPVQNFIFWSAIATREMARKDLYMAKIVAKSFISMGEILKDICGTLQTVSDKFIFLGMNDFFIVNSSSKNIIWSFAVPLAKRYWLKTMSPTILCRTVVFAFLVRLEMWVTFVIWYIPVWIKIILYILYLQALKYECSDSPPTRLVVRSSVILPQRMFGAWQGFNH